MSTAYTIGDCLIIRVAQCRGRYTQHQKHKSTELVGEDLRSGGYHSCGKVRKEDAEGIRCRITVGCRGGRRRKERKLMRQKVPDLGGRGRPALRKRKVKVNEIVKRSEHREACTVQA